MTFSTEFRDSVNVVLGIDVYKETEDSLRKKLERFLETSIDTIIGKIGHAMSEEDVVITKEQNNSLYMARSLYNEFMENILN